VTISDFSTISALLGIKSPFAITKVDFDIPGQHLDIFVQEELRDTSLPKFMGVHRWAHVGVCGYTTIIHFKTLLPRVEASDIPSTMSPIVGLTSKRYTNASHDVVNASVDRGISHEYISQQFKLPLSIIDNIISDRKSKPQSPKTLALVIPDEEDAVWRELLKDVTVLNSGFQALNFMLVQLKSNCKKANYSQVSFDSGAAKLFQFVNVYSARLASEIAQIQKLAQSLNKVVPITGSDSNSQNIDLSHLDEILMELILGSIEYKCIVPALSYYITLEKSKIISNSRNSAETKQCQSQIKLFLLSNLVRFKDDIENLKNLSLDPKDMTNSILETIPSITNPVWQQLITGSQCIRSKRIAFNLKVVQGRSHEDMQIACRNLYDFVVDNAPSFKPEILQINKLA